MKKLALLLSFLLSLLLVLTLTACAEDRQPDLTLTSKPAVESTLLQSPIYLSSEGRAIHRDKACRHIADSEGISAYEGDNETVAVLLSMGYTLCGDCFADRPSEEGE